jgi:uncharacterized protein YndB with AHSA1/START domain
MPEPMLYCVEREFSSRVECVWDAWTDASQLEAWYHPVGLASIPGTTVSNAVAGGYWAVTVDVPEFGFTAFFFGEYTEVLTHQRLAHTMLYTQSADEFAARDLGGPHHDVTVDFEARGDRTWVRFTQFGELPEGQAEQAQAGMESYFDSLQSFLADLAEGAAS